MAESVPWGSMSAATTARPAAPQTSPARRVLPTWVRNGRIAPYRRDTAQREPTQLYREAPRWTATRVDAVPRARASPARSLPMSTATDLCPDATADCPAAAPARGRTTAVTAGNVAGPARYLLRFPMLPGVLDFYRAPRRKRARLLPADPARPGRCPDC